MTTDPAPDRAAQPLDLDAIRQRVTRRYLSSDPRVAFAVNGDALALLAEVDRLRASRRRTAARIRGLREVQALVQDWGETWEDEYKTTDEEAERLRTRLAAAEARCAELTTALEHYADVGNWDSDMLDAPEGSVRVYEPLPDAGRDGWDVARAALAGPGTEEEAG